MRSLHVIQRYFPFQGGSERYFQALSERLAAAGDMVQVVTSQAWDLEYFWDPARRAVVDGPLEHNGVAIRRVPVAHLPLPSLSHRAIRRLMAESCRLPLPGRLPLLRLGSRYGPWLPALPAELEAAGPVDLVHSANIAFESVIAAAQAHARRHDLPHLVTPFVHLGERPGSKVRRYYTMPHQLALLARADAVMTLTELEAEYLAARGVPEQVLHVVGAGIDVPGSTGGIGERAREALGSDGPLVLALGAAAFDKGSLHLLAAVRSLRRAGLPVELVFAGPMLSDFQAALAAIPANERGGIHALGFVSDEAKRDLLAAADMLALPSRTESFGLVFLEAWANGKPVIGARAGAIPAVVADGVDGLLVEFGDAPGLAAALRRLVEEPGLRAELGRNGRRKVVDEAEWFGRVRAVYNQVLGSRGSVASGIGVAG
ncbi:MAG TPA: glycosyltransferase family 4 protein [Thermomicrobiaceae bacterium]|nr:glycosyltransferase family 4 protein [Thermomicrobiaceae bacterium]